MTRPTYNVRISWAGNGTFADYGDDVTDRALARTPITIQYGRDQARALAPIAPGRAVLELDNTSRDYSPENADSPLVDLLGPGRPVRITADHQDIRYTLYRGYLDDYEVEPSIENRSVSFTMLDGLARLAEAKISTELQFGITTGTAIGYVLDAAGWGSERDLDQGSTLIRYWWEEGTDALTAVKNLVAAEGPPAIVFIDGQGRFVFRDRQHRLTDDPSLTSQATFYSEGPAEPVISPPLLYDLGWRDIVNSITLDVPERSPEGELSDVWSSSATYTLEDGETVDVIAKTGDPFIGAVTPVETTGVDEDIIEGDYTLLSGAVTIALDVTAGASATISITASGGPAVLTNLKLRAYSVSVSRTYQVHVEDGPSIAKHGLRSYPEDIPWVGVHDALAVAQLIVNHRADRLPVVTATFKNDGGDWRIVQQLGRDLSDRVTIIDEDTDLDLDFYIETIQHKTDGIYHETVFGCEKVRDAELEADAFRFNTSGQGFNDGVFEGVGLVAPSMMFRFDTDDQGFDEARFSY